MWLIPCSDRAATGALMAPAVNNRASMVRKLRNRATARVIMGQRDRTQGVAASALPMRLRAMLYLIIKAALSGIIIAIVSEVAKRYPGFGALIASLPLVSLLGAIWLWRDKPDPTNMAFHLEATFWFVLPSLPMFLLVPWMMRAGLNFWPALLIGCAITIGLYLMMTWLGPRIGLRL
jgi:hypothetical protein